MEQVQENENGNKAIFWIFAGIIVVILLIFFWKLYQDNKKKKAQALEQEQRQNLYTLYQQQAQAKNEPKAPISVQGSSDQDTADFPLQFGDKGKKVEQLQMYMLRHWGWQGKVDGIWGAETQRAVEKYLQTKQVSENLFDLYNLGSLKTTKFK